MDRGEKKIWADLLRRIARNTLFDRATCPTILHFELGGCCIRRSTVQEFEKYSRSGFGALHMGCHIDNPEASLKTFRTGGIFLL